MPTTDQKIDDLARMVAQGFTEVHGELADIRSTMATKDDLARLRSDMDIMLDRHVGTFRKDYDGLAGRVKKLEDQVFAR